MTDSIRSKEAILNINIEKINNLVDYVCFCKYYFKPKTYEKINGYLYFRNNKPKAIDRNKFKILIKDIPFLKSEYIQEIEKNELNGNLFKFL